MVLLLISWLDQKVTYPQSVSVYSGSIQLREKERGQQKRQGVKERQRENSNFCRKSIVRLVWKVYVSTICGLFYI